MGNRFQPIITKNIRDILYINNDLPFEKIFLRWEYIMHKLPIGYHDLRGNPTIPNKGENWVISSKVGIQRRTTSILDLIGRSNREHIISRMPPHPSIYILKKLKNLGGAEETLQPWVLCEWRNISSNQNLKTHIPFLLTSQSHSWWHIALGRWWKLYETWN